MSEGALPLGHVDAPAPLLRLLPDARLARLAANGSAPAFSVIYRRHHQAIYRYCRSLLGDEHDARDALQNTMLKAMSALEGEQREINLRPWLFRIAHNESISLLRRRSPDVGIEAAAGLASDGTDLDARQRLRGLLADLDQLTERQRGALVMRELSGLEFEEIGAALEISPEGAKQALYEARLALRELERGREMSCDDVCRRISEQDRRRLRGREVRAHLKSCGDCRAFAEQMPSRRGQLSALTPPLPAPVAIAVLEGIIGGGGGGAAAGAGAGAGVLGGGAAAGLGGSAAVKVGVAAVVAVGFGGAALERSKSALVDGPATAVEAKAGAAGGSEASSAGAAGAGRADGASTDAGSPDGGGPGGSAPASANAGGPGSTPPGHGGTPPGRSGSSPGVSGSTPGQGAIPPGQGGTPPGQTGSSPGSSGSTPGHVGAPPGQGGAQPAASATPPAASPTPPSQGGTPPGQTGSSPGSSGSTPGHAGALPGQTGK